MSIFNCVYIQYILYLVNDLSICVYYVTYVLDYIYIVQSPLSSHNATFEKLNRKKKFCKKNAGPGEVLNLSKEL